MTEIKNTKPQYDLEDRTYLFAQKVRDYVNSFGFYKFGFWICLEFRILDLGF